MISCLILSFLLTEICMKTNYYFYYLRRNLFSFLCCPIMCIYVLSSTLWFPHILCSVPLYLQMFIGGLISYLRYLCLFVHSGVKHILCCVFDFPFVLCTLCYQFLWIVHFWFPLRYSLTFIYKNRSKLFHCLSRVWQKHDLISSNELLSEWFSRLELINNLSWARYPGSGVTFIIHMSLSEF